MENSSISDLVQSFSASLTSIIEADAAARARAAVETAFGIEPRRGPGLPVKARKKPPRQLCPVPGCKNSAAPVFGMVCGAHRDVSKTKIRKYREARRAKKIGT
jgi:hypothetical protein